MHAGWSLGAAAGAGLGAAVITVGGPAALHLGLNGAVCVAVLLGVRRLFLAEDPADPVPTDDASDEASARPTPARSRVLPPRAALAVLVPAVVIAMAGFGVEEFGNAWATLFLITERGLDPAAAVLGASTLLGAQFVGRLAGDRTLAALGRRGALTAGLGAVVVGLGLALAPLPGPVAVPAAFAGLALAGLGCAVVVPVAYALGDEAPGLRPQTGLAVTSWCMRLAGVGLSPAVGALAGGRGTGRRRRSGTGADGVPGPGRRRGGARRPAARRPVGTAQSSSTSPARAWAARCSSVAASQISLAAEPLSSTRATPSTMSGQPEPAHAVTPANATRPHRRSRRCGRPSPRRSLASRRARGKAPARACTPGSP